MYRFYFPGFLVGPSLEYADYDILIHGTLFKQLEKKDDTGRGSKKLIPKGRKRVAYRRMVLGLAMLGTYVTFSGNANLTVTVQDWYMKRGFLYRYVLFVSSCHVLILNLLHHQCRLPAILRTDRAHEVLRHLDVDGGKFRTLYLRLHFSQSTRGPRS